MAINTVFKGYNKESIKEEELSEWHEEVIRIRSATPKTALELAITEFV